MINIKVGEEYITRKGNRVIIHSTTVPGDKPFLGVWFNEGTPVPELWLDNGYKYENTLSDHDIVGPKPSTLTIDIRDWPRWLPWASVDSWGYCRLSAIKPELNAAGCSWNFNSETAVCVPSDIFHLDGDWKQSVTARPNA